VYIQLIDKKNNYSKM